MRLDFNVLWVDDQPERVDAQIRRIAMKMEEEGFEFNPTRFQSIEGVRELIGGSLFADEVDLILVDWDLGDGAHGQDVIAAIRETVAYKDVVFYSAHSQVDTLRRLAFEKNLEGIYCASREDLVDEVLGVFDSLVKKVLDLDHARGIVMGATSDIDYMVNECLTAIYSQSSEAGRATILKQSLRYVEKQRERFNDVAAKLGGATHLSEFLDAHILLTSYDRLGILARALKAKILEPQKEFRPSVVTYQQEVVPQRNVLGHAVLVPGGKRSTLIDSKGKVIYSLEKTRDLRRLILTLRSDFRKLLLALRGNVVGTATSPPSGARTQEID